MNIFKSKKVKNEPAQMKDESDAFYEVAEKRVAYMGEKIKDLEQAVKDRDFLIACFAHELKAPLAATLGLGSLLQGFNKNPYETKQTLQKLYAENKRLEHLPDKLMALFNMSGGQRIKAETVSLSNLIEQLNNTVDYILAKRYQGLVTEIKAPAANLDPELFLILLRNLVENASKASKDRTKIKVSAVKNTDIIFIVEDTGCGMNEEQVKQLFAPFSNKGDNSEKPVGLLLCKTIVEAHGGGILVESETNKGTKVSVRIPNK